MSNWLIIFFLILNQGKPLTVVDYQTKELLSGVNLLKESKIVGKTKPDGQIIVDLNDTSNYRFRYVGYHDLLVKGVELRKTDTLYLFTSKMVFTKRGSRVEENKLIKDNRICHLTDSIVYEYDYDPKQNTLTLIIKNAR